MLPARHHACAETTGAERSSRIMTCNPLSNVKKRTSSGIEVAAFVDDESAAVKVWIIVHSTSANAHWMARGSYTRAARGEGGRFGDVILRSPLTGSVCGAPARNQ